MADGSLESINASFISFAMLGLIFLSKVLVWFCWSSSFCDFDSSLFISTFLRFTQSITLKNAPRKEPQVPELKVSRQDMSGLGFGPVRGNPEFSGTT